MFIALDENKQPINLLTNDRELKKKLLEKKFYCPQCHEPLIIKYGTKKRMHFAHKVSGCLLGRNETEVHLLAKEKLFTYFHQKNIRVEIEYVINSINQRPDLFFRISTISYAIEFQHSTISNDDIRERIENYKKNDIMQIWLIDTKIMKKKGKVLKLQPFLYEIMKLEHYETLKLFCPYEETITIVHSFLFIHSTKVIATEKMIPLKHSSISTFLSIKLQKQYDFQAFFTQIEKEKRNILLYYKQYEKFVYLLYENEIGLVQTWWIGIPTKSNYDFDTSCIIWQGYLVLFWKKAIKFTLEESIHYIEELINSGRIRIRSEETQIINSAVQQYIDLLVHLNIISKEVSIFQYNELFVERNNNYLYEVLEKYYS